MCKKNMQSLLHPRAGRKDRNYSQIYVVKETSLKHSDPPLCDPNIPIQTFHDLQEVPNRKSI